MKDQRVLDEYYPNSLRVKMVFMRGRGRDTLMIPVREDDFKKELKKR